MALTLGELYTSPDHYLQSFDGDAALFVPMDRAAYGRSIFLDGRISPAGEGEMRIPLAMLGQPPSPQPIHWIFHVAHCGSTLLARALDRPETNLVLREPLVLRQSAVRPDARRLAIAAAMTSKRYLSAAPTIVKANVPINFILPDLGALNPQARAIFLHLGLRDYLLAILRSDNHREWLGRVTGQLAPHLGDLRAFSDAERAAALWVAQTRAFAVALAALPNACSLNAELFFSEPRVVLAAAVRLFGMSMTDTAIDELVAGPLFATYSKDPAQAFDNDARIARRIAIEASIADELAQADAWIERFAPDVGEAQARIGAAPLLA